MSKVLDTARSLVDHVEAVLQGEPVRAIGYGAAAIIYVAAKALGSIPDVTPEQALVQATAAIGIVTTVVESIRHYVYSPATVLDLFVEQAADAAAEGNG